MNEKKEKYTPLKVYLVPGLVDEMLRVSGTRKTSELMNIFNKAVECYDFAEEHIEKGSKVYIYDRFTQTPVEPGRISSVSGIDEKVQGNDKVRIFTCGMNNELLCRLKGYSAKYNLSSVDLVSEFCRLYVMAARAELQGGLGLVAENESGKGERLNLLGMGTIEGMTVPLNKLK